MSLRRSFQNPATRYLLLTGFLTFMLIGAQQAMYGPAFPAFRERYGLSADQVAAVVSLHFLGSFTTISLAGLLIQKLGYRKMLVGAATLFAAGAFGIALSPVWSLTLAFALLVGFGFGALDLGVNLLFVRSFEAGSAPALNLLNAMFGVGAILGPLWVGAFLPSVAAPFLAVGVLGLLPLALLARVSDPPPPTKTEERSALPYGRLTGFMLIYFFYVAAEVSAASWETTHLEPYLGLARAAQLPALFWAAMTIGRFIATPLSSRLRPADLVLGSAALGLVGVLLTNVIAFAPVAYAIIGFAFAPFFPTSITWVQRVFPQRAEQIVPIVVAVANLGPVAGSWFIGLVVARASSDAVPLALLGLTLPLFAVTALLWVRSRRA